MLNVAEQLPEDWRINYAGDGADRDWMESEISKRHLEQRIRLLGALDDEQLDWHYTQASMFLCLSRWEGFGLVVVEAMSRGLPVIAFDMPAMEEVLQEGKTGFCSQWEIPLECAGPLQSLPTTVVFGSTMLRCR